MDSYNGYLFLSVQKNQTSDNPGADEIYQVGIIAKIEKSQEQNNGTYKVIIQGLERAVIREFIEQEDHVLVKAAVLEEIFDKEKNFYDLSKNLISIFEEYINLKKVRIRGIVAKLQTNQISEITDIIVSVISIPINVKQSLL